MEVQPEREVGLTSARKAECADFGLTSVSARLAGASGETGCHDTVSAVVSKFGWEREAESEGRGHEGVLRC